MILVTRIESSSGGAHPNDFMGVKYFSKEHKRFIKEGDVFSNSKGKAVAEQIVKNHFEKEKTMGAVSSLEIPAEENDVFGFMLSEKGFEVDGFTSYAERASDGVSMS